MRFGSVTVDQIKNTTTLILHDVVVNELIAKFNGQVVSGVKSGSDFTFIFNNEFLDYVISFESGGEVLFKYFLTKPRGASTMYTIDTEVWIKGEIGGKLRPTFEGEFYAKDITFNVSTEYDRGLTDGIILGKLI